MPQLSWPKTISTAADRIDKNCIAKETFASCHITDRSGHSSVSIPRYLTRHAVSQHQPGFVGGQNHALRRYRECTRLQYRPYASAEKIQLTLNRPKSDQQPATSYEAQPVRARSSSDEVGETTTRNKTTAQGWGRMKDCSK